MDYRALRHIADLVEEDFKLGKKPTKTSYSETMLEYLALLTSGKCHDNVKYASEIYEDNSRREVVEAALFGGATDEELDEVFGLSIELLVVYRELFFDLSVFRTKLDKIGYLENYPDAEGRELKLRAYSLGPEFIYFRYGNLVPKTENQRALVKKMFLSSAYRAMEANFNPINSKVSKISLDHAKIMLKSFEAMEKLLQNDTSDNYDLVALLVDRKVTTAAGITKPEINEPETPKVVDDSEIV